MLHLHLWWFYLKSSPQVYSPVSGTVTEKNVVVEDGPALINQNAEDEGWLFKWVLGNWHWDKMIWQTSSVSRIMVIMIYSQAGLVRGWRGVRVDEHWGLWDLPQGGMRGSLSETHTFAAYETNLTDWNIFSPNTFFHHLKLNLWQKPNRNHISILEKRSKLRKELLNALLVNMCFECLL